jgi:hypothetical protein
MKITGKTEDRESRDPVSEEGVPSEEDHVDRVQAEWRAVQPELDPAPVAIVARIGRIAAYFDQSTNALMSERPIAELVGRAGEPAARWTALRALADGALSRADAKLGSYD